ncbi:type 1 glycerol-3-phosphate oxidase [Tetragenococcus halophilus]|uniref:type 1 glycerol-3-phosphate oxidase n=1 Tax=Tetragenococcus halophilus TaxID=51669 RepID=UPI00077C0E8B|nr:type 1 glycerol-3-phosphate oxidase [Tetragenococcus halophilus]AOF49045.1 alpha-glycerophosphate oxidase [Tetragenococcus halophilus]NRR75428.1 type 1 glycerol-3-phosphate oxidase [Tetragenococcus halophilus]NWO00112.1 type 1 glycerol-3-phosphate oxidase [Tetragenococcus halophilus]QXN87686.1 type 1 glycerol-3-phosphate oxidase [Tetragenococcus halophilus]WJS82917.1 type 1 glycerol-3-phosphate oxidase [Tetragenococcus halophilus]
MVFSYKTRNEEIQKVQDEELDLLVIGGGITGAGVAVQAAASGMKTALVEMQDFAEGTSSRSTKLVHGGIRYLKTFDVEVVNDTVKERANVQHIAPHIPKPDPMLLPIYDEAGATFNMFSAKVAMDLYDRLAGVTGKFANYTLNKSEVLERQPQLEKEGLQGGGVYLDFRNNDSRLVIENIKKAHEDGARVLNKVKVVKITHDQQGMVNGADVQDVISGRNFHINAKVVINTSGPWTDEVRDLDKKDDLSDQMRPTKGVHLVVDKEKLNVPQPTYFDTGENDGRMIFVVPREDKTYFGTTDTDYHGDLKHPKVTQEDVDYLLRIVNRRYPDAKIGLDDIEASWAGLRPLITANGGSDYNGGGGGSEKLSDESFNKVVNTTKEYLEDDAKRDDVEKAIQEADSAQDSGEVDPSQISRGSSLEEASDGLVTLSGGKITDYRLMAEGALKKINEKLDSQFDLIDSKEYPVSGGDIDPDNVDEEIKKLAKQAQDKGLNEKDALYLANLYGSNLPTVLTYDEPIKGLSQRDSFSLNYALNEELVLTPVDYFLRRTNFILFIRDELDALEQPVLDKMAEFYQWSDEEKANYQKELAEVVAESDLKELKEDEYRE